MSKALLKKSDRCNIGVIVGRFQSPNLHKVHKKLISAVCSKHINILVFLGVSPVLGSRRDPLDFESRKIMIQKDFPSVTILPIKDMKSDERWSKQLDAKIMEIYPRSKVILYGGRDSFIKSYSGKFEVFEFEQHGSSSATEERKKVAEKVNSSEDWRAGVMYGIFNQYEKAVMCVDIALMRNNRKEIILGRRKTEDQYRFFGGHIDPNDESLEYGARRELLEEAGGNLEVSCLNYVGSFQVDDWRYRKNCDKIMTALFVGDHLFGNLKAGDDIDELKSFNVKDFLNDDFFKKNLVEEHFPLMKKLIDFTEREVCPCRDTKK